MKQKSREVKKNMHASRFLALLFGFIGTACLFLMILVIVIDPFFHYHAPLTGFPYKINDQLSQNPGLARHTKYNAVSLGSSVTTDYHISWFRELFDLDAVKLPYNGAYPKDIVNAMEQVDKSNNKIKAVFIGVDAASYSADISEIKYPLPEYLYDDDPFNDVSYLFNKDVLLEYIAKPLFKPLLRPNAEPDDPLDYYSNYRNLTYGEENVNRSFTLQDSMDPVKDPELVRVPIEKNWETNIQPLIEGHPDCMFYFYFPPRSILYWCQACRKGLFDTYLFEERFLTEHLLDYENVQVHFIQNDAETITDLSHYTDETHFDQGTSYKVLKFIQEGTYLATKENYQVFLKDFETFVKNYKP